jgi:hypothetical protein
MGEDEQPQDDQLSGRRIRLNLALPTPGALSGDGGDGYYAFPFAPPSRLCRRCRPLMLRRRWHGSSRASPCESCEISLVWHVMTLKGESQLGHFGFCTGVMAGGNQLFYFPWHRPYHFSTFGPTSARAFIEDFLGMLSGSARPGRKPEDLLETGNDRPDSRFPRTQFWSLRGQP